MFVLYAKENAEGEPVNMVQEWTIEFYYDRPECATKRFDAMMDEDFFELEASYLINNHETGMRLVAGTHTKTKQKENKKTRTRIRKLSFPQTARGKADRKRQQEHQHAGTPNDQRQFPRVEKTSSVFQEELALEKYLYV